MRRQQAGRQRERVDTGHWTLSQWMNNSRVAKRRTLSDIHRASNSIDGRSLMRYILAAQVPRSDINSAGHVGGPNAVLTDAESYCR